MITKVNRNEVKESNGHSCLIDIDHWSVGDVGDWLDSTLLSQYKDIFMKNQISGPILLDISLEDLDYMSVTALGHRKVSTTLLPHSITLNTIN
jgi:hypothetical protein